MWIGVKQQENAFILEVPPEACTLHPSAKRKKGGVVGERSKVLFVEAGAGYLGSLCWFFFFFSSLCLCFYNLGAPGWLSRLSVLLLISAQVMISGSWDQAPG